MWISAKWILFFLLPATSAIQSRSTDFVVTDEVASFIAQAVVDVFNATYVEILIGSKFDNATPLVSSKLHLASVATTTLRLYNRDSAVEFMKRAYNGLPTNTKFYAISLLSQEEYLTFIFPLMENLWTRMVYSYWIVLGNGHDFGRLILQQKPCTFYLITEATEGYVLLGPSYAKRKNCSGVLTIAQWPKPRGATSLMLTPPAREERSNVLVLTCGDTGIHGNKAYYCNLPQEEDALPMIRRGLNITHFQRVIAPLPFIPYERFPQAGTYSGHLTHGEADIRVNHAVMSDVRAFSTQFSFPIQFYNLGYLFASPRILKSNFTVLKLFSVPAWCLLGLSLALLVFMLRVVSYVELWFLRSTCVDKVLRMPENAEPSVVRRKLSVRILLVTLQFLFFVISYCFMGGYISFLNKPILEEAPDTKDKLLEMLQKERLQPCISNNSFETVILTRTKSASLSRLRDAVVDWVPFIAQTMNACVERTRQRKAVYFAAAHILDRYAESFRGQVQVSMEYAQDVVLPKSYLLPKASPYKDMLQNVIMRMVEAGLVDQFEVQYWYRFLPAPSSFLTEDAEQPLHISDSTLQFIVLTAGLGAALVALVCEVLWGKVKKLRRH